MDTAGVIGVVGIVVALVAAIVGYVTYRNQRGRRRLEYLVQARVSVLPAGVARDLEVTHCGTTVGHPAVVVVRIVNSGDRPIQEADFATDLFLNCEGVQAILAATVTQSRPLDFRPHVIIDGTDIRIEPTLINPGDMAQLQVLTDGKPERIILSGRIANLSTFSRRESLPYPPGSGTEGEMLGFDRFMWYLLMPLTLASLAAGASALATTTLFSRIIAISVSAATVVALHLFYTQYLVRRRRLWRP